MPTAKQDEKQELTKALLKGHRGPVTCLAHSSSIADGRPVAASSRSSAAPQPQPPSLLSGSSDGTARLWDLRTQRAALCIVAPVDADGDSDITSVAFHPLSSTTSSLGGGGAANTYSRDMTIYLSVGCGVYGYDLRNANAPIIRSYMYDADLSSALQCEDEVNEVVFSDSRAGANGKIRFAVADDMGDVRVMENVPFKLSSDSNENNKERKLQRCRVLQHAIDDENAMATCLAFRPRGANDLVSGGTDCAIRLWDVSRPQRPSSSVQISGDESGNAQVCNPPFVNQIAFSKHGTLIAAALGDGTASILGIKGRSISQRCRLSGGHSSSVASVLFPSFGSETSSNIAANDRLLVTGGSDGIMFWDIGSEVAGKNAVDPSTWLCCAPSSADNIAEDLSSLSLDEQKRKKKQPRKNENVGPRVLFGIAHGEKINTITSDDDRTLFVADTSDDVTAYMIARS